MLNVSVFDPQRIQYSKMDSDVIAKLKGTFTERPKKPKRTAPVPEDPAESKKSKRKIAKEQARMFQQQQQQLQQPIAPVQQPPQIQPGIKY